ncbi:CcoQ/FixQ family Cbb3-type cytochrome c oxidase assembly chaperone [Ekhidna sp.]|uniref:CcoQ/FixQ family Cbb3-type cytochrome c oxidase assembly chaperone n=1 Tax=Ekhidna sp. TaxID=2608089 RepID=UPI003B50DB11
MLKFIKHHMESIAGIEIYPVISFVIFFVFFIALTIYVLKVDKKLFNDISNIPLNEKESDNEQA